jgi:hypothetical protein
VIPDNASTLRITAAAGTELAGASQGVPSSFVPLLEVYNPRAFIPHAVSLHQAFAHCGRFLTAASRRSGARVSVPLWPVTLSGRLRVVALVGHYPTNELMRRGPIPKRKTLLTPQEAGAHPGLAAVSHCYTGLGGRSPTCYSPVRHSVTKDFTPKRSVQGASFDLHV